MAARISIVTPSYLQAAFLERTLRSVLDQDVDGLEHVVCDGGSTDGTLEILRSHGGRMRWVSEPDGGQAEAVNKGIRMSSGEVIGWLNSDDVYYPGALTAVLSYFDAHPDAEVVYGDADHIDDQDAVLEPYYTENWDYERLKEVCYLCQPAVFFRRRVVDRFGPLDHRLRYCMDYEYWLRVGEQVRFERLSRRLAGSRLYPACKSLRDGGAAHEEIGDMLERRLGRVPTRWIWNYAFAVVDAVGCDRARLHRHGWLFMRAVARGFLRWRGYVPWEVVRSVRWALWDAFRRERQALRAAPR